MTTAVLTGRPLGVTDEQAALWETISNWNLSRELLYMKNRVEGYADAGDAYLQAMAVEYKRFMFLIAAYPDRKVPMGKRLDDMWHTAVLHTQNYIAFCKTVYAGAGGYIHHNPTVSVEEDTALWPDYVGVTLELYRKHFGEPTAQFWDTQDVTTPCCTN